jgi:hypothetical protein
VTALVLILYPFIMGYSRGKGTNLATKQDIAKITNEIESVKIQYAEEIERLKTVLQISASNKSMVQEKKNEALIQFFEDCMILYNEKLIKNPFDLPPKKGQELMEYQNAIEHIFTKILSDYYRLFIYFEKK